MPAILRKSVLEESTRPPMLSWSQDLRSYDPIPDRTSLPSCRGLGACIRLRTRAWSRGREGRRAVL
jgi:hypothetical protein